MPIDEYVVAGPEEDQTGQVYEPHSRFVHVLSVIKMLRGWTTAGDIYLRIGEQPQFFTLPSEAVVSQTLYNLSSTIGIAAWGTTEQGLWASVARGSNVGDVSRFLTVDQPLALTAAGQMDPLSGDFGYWLEEDTVEPLLEPITLHDRRMMALATSLDFTQSELLPQFEDED